MFKCFGPAIEVTMYLCRTPPREWYVTVETSNPTYNPFPATPLIHKMKEFRSVSRISITRTMTAMYTSLILLQLIRLTEIHVEVIRDSCIWPLVYLLSDDSSSHSCFCGL